MCVHSGRAILALMLAVCLPTVALAQTPEPTALGPLSGEPRFFAAFSAKAVTRVVQRTNGNAHIARKVVATYYRDSSGRVRVDYVANSDLEGDGAKGSLLMPNPYARTDRVFLVDGTAKTVEMGDFGILAWMFNASPRGFSIATALKRFTVFRTAEDRFSGNGLFEDLGTQTIGGVEAKGVRFTVALSKAVEERWESPDLDVVVYGRHVDPGDPEGITEIEYTLTEIQRTEPPQELFAMPAGYQLSPPSHSWEIDSPGAELRRVSESKKK
jgi:hypothetical protein